MSLQAESIKQSLFALTSKGIKYDLDRIAAAALHVGSPHLACPSVHVAGTNGKGSTCTYIESVLREAGYATGLFTSPHITLFEERFRIGGAMIDEEAWLAVYDEMRTVIEKFNLTFFEATMLIGSELFRRLNVEWAIFETGLGGRLDATNILQPRVSVITRLAMDHRDLLGNTLAEIAAEKLGIVKDDTPLVIADPGDETLRGQIAATCSKKHAPVTFVGESRATSVEVTSAGTAFFRDGVRYTTRLAGRFQIVNALLAIEALEQTGLSLPVAVIRRGIASAHLSGRFQQFWVKEKIVVIDVGHNPDAAAELCTALSGQFKGKSICMVVGIMADKEYPLMIARYITIAHHIILTRPKTERAAPADDLACHVPASMRTVCADVAEAVHGALYREEEVICITGSFFTVGEAVAGGLLPVQNMV